jgi:hypothetical protein
MFADNYIKTIKSLAVINAMGIEDMLFTEMAHETVFNFFSRQERFSDDCDLYYTMEVVYKGAMHKEILFNFSTSLDNYKFVAAFNGVSSLDEIIDYVAIKGLSDHCEAKGVHVLYYISRGGNSDIYLFNLNLTEGFRGVKSCMTDPYFSGDEPKYLDDVFDNLYKQSRYNNGKYMILEAGLGQEGISITREDSLNDIEVKIMNDMLKGDKLL